MMAWQKLVKQKKKRKAILIFRQLVFQMQANWLKPNENLAKNADSVQTFSVQARKKVRKISKASRCFYILPIDYENTLNADSMMQQFFIQAKEEHR